MTALPTSKRNEMVLFYEGCALRSAGEHDAELGADMARCMVDGAVNALIRLEGAEAAAHYTFALSDRVVGRVRAPTLFTPLAAPPKLIEPPKPETKKPEPETPAPASDRPMRFWTIFVVGWLCGFVMAIGVRP